MVNYGALPVYYKGGNIEMSVQVEKLEKSMAKLTIEVPAKELDLALDKAYKKNRNKIAMPGFRKGKAPRAMIEKMYGAEIFFEDAANILVPDAYEDAAKESGLEIVSQPEIAVEQIEKGQPFIFTATVAVKPEVTLGEYKGIEVESKEAGVTDEEIEEEINKVRENNSRMITIEDRAVEDGDTVTIDFDGYVDGEQFEGGMAEDYSLVIGSHTFIDNFEEQLIGKNIGDDVEVNVTFPDQYQAEELRNKEALFKVKINAIKMKELPDADDEFAQEVSDFDTLDEYKEDLRKKLLENKEAALKREKEEEVVGAIIENAQMDIPDPMVNAQTQQMTQEFAQRLQSQGLSLEQYMQLTGMTPQKMLEELKPQALKRIQSRLVLEAVVAAENIEASEEDFDKEIENMAEMYNMEADKLRDLVGEDEKEQIRMDIAVQKAVDFVVEASVEK
jgi:trigger factor